MAFDLIEKTKSDRARIVNTLENLEANFDLEMASKTNPQLTTDHGEQQQKQQQQPPNLSLSNSKVFLETPEFYRNFFPIKVIPRNEIMSKVCYQSCKYRAFKYLWKEGSGQISLSENF